VSVSMIFARRWVHFTCKARCVSGRRVRRSFLVLGSEMGSEMFLDMPLFFQLPSHRLTACQWVGPYMRGEVSFGARCLRDFHVGV
jgi:hypothetical protein